MDFYYNQEERKKYAGRGGTSTKKTKKQLKALKKEGVKDELIDVLVPPLVSVAPIKVTRRRVK